MRADLDQFMEDRGIDWILCFGNPSISPELRYFLRRSGIHGFLLKGRGQEPVLIHGDMEREEAAATGLATQSMGTLGFSELRKEAKSGFETSVLFSERIFEKYGVTGTVGFYGTTSFARQFHLVQALCKRRPDVTISTEHIDFDEDIFQLARITKDPDEVAAIRHVGRMTEEIVAEIRAFLSTCKEGKDGAIDGPDGPVTVGDIKRRIAHGQAERNLEGEEFIFAPGREGSVPHNRGTPERVLRAGEPIVFDIFPKDRETGYHFDMTRTWCLGHVTEEAQKIYDDVKASYDAAVSALGNGVAWDVPDRATCDVLEERGHPTLRSVSGTTAGYCHSLGHGIGLDLHERPSLSHIQKSTNTLEPGMVFTIEPGLYYPDKEMGCRLEDVYWIQPDGTVERISTDPLDLLIPLQG